MHKIHIESKSTKGKWRKLEISFTLLLPNRDHMMDSDKLGHAQTWEF